MSLWVLIVLLGVAKLPIAGLMLWLPFREDQTETNAPAINDAADSGTSEDEGGSKALPACPLDPHPRPRSPRPHPRHRGPHGSDPAPPPPARVRAPAIGHGQTQRAGQRLRLR